MNVRLAASLARVGKTKVCGHLQLPDRLVVGYFKIVDDHIHFSRTRHCSSRAIASASIDYKFLPLN
jgi:hypothetical protein